MEIFSGKIQMLGYPNITSNTTRKEFFCGNINLRDSEFYNEHYCGNNFNNILKSFKILFDLMVVNQWHGILSICFFFLLGLSVRLSVRASDFPFLGVSLFMCDTNPD